MLGEGAVAVLDTSDVRAYRDQGYVILRQRIQPEELESARALISGLVDQYARDYLRDGRISSMYEEASFERRLARINEESGIKTRNWALAGAMKTAEHFQLALHPTILDSVESVLGPEIAWTGSYSARPKLPEHELTAVPWHQDSQYYGEATRHLHVVTVWIPLVDVDDRNGCLLVIPRSSDWGLLKGERGEDLNVRTFEDVETRGESVALPMQQGDILLFSNLLFHTSKFNTTNSVRWSVDLRYVEPEVSRERSEEQQEGYNTLKAHYRAESVTVRSRQPEMIASLAQLQKFVGLRSAK